MGTFPGKKANNSDSGSTHVIGGNDYDDMIDYHNNVDKTGPVKINTRTYTRSGKRELRNPADTASYVEVASAIVADREVTEPLLTANDTRVYENHPQTLISKTLKLEANTMALRFGTIVFKVSSTYYAVKSDGTLISSGAVPETVIQAAIDSGDSNIYIKDGSYVFSGGFAGLNITTGHQTIMMGDNTILQVPNGYTGALWYITGNILGFRMEGGKFDEAGTPQKLWKGIHLKSTGSSAAIKHCHFKHIQIDHAGWMVYLECTVSGAFINSCVFQQVFGYYPIIGFEWVDFAGNEGFIHNFYDYIDIQADANTTFGFKNVMARNAVLVNPTVQDMGATNTQMQIDSSATDTLIVGGSLLAGGTTGLFTDNGARTKIIGSRSGSEGLRLNACNIVTDTTTGIKIGTGTTQRLGFFNKTPAVQQTGGAATAAGTYGAGEQTMLQKVYDCLRTFGFLS